MYGSTDSRSNRGQSEGGNNNDGIDDSKRGKSNNGYQHSQQAPLLPNHQRSFNNYEDQKESFEGGLYGSIPNSGGIPMNMAPPSMGQTSLSPMHGYRPRPPSYMHSQPPLNLQQPPPMFAPPHHVPNGGHLPSQYYMTPLYQSMWQQQSQQQSIPPPPPPKMNSQQYAGESSLSLLDNTLDYSDEDDLPTQRSPTATAPPIKIVSASSSTIPTSNIVSSTPVNFGASSSTTIPTSNIANNWQQQQQQSRRKKHARKTFSFNELPIGESTPPTIPKSKHRRNKSDFGYQQKRSDSSIPKPTHRRTSSAELSSRSPLPLHPFHRKTAPRNRSHSYGAPPRHRRADSASSVASIFSDRSIVSDISKSALFKDVTETGTVRFHAPIDNVRLTMSKHLIQGELYQVKHGDDEEERYVAYTMQSDDNFSDYLFNDEGPGGDGDKNNMESILYPSRYVLRVGDDLYRRVIKEISDSRQPCGLFFCGHHEDVDRPSIFIAVFIVALMFGAMFIFIFFNPC